MTARADIDALYRTHEPAITASLARAFGAHRLDIIEAGVQEAFIAALVQWRDLCTNGRIRIGSSTTRSRSTSGAARASIRFRGSAAPWNRAQERRARRSGSKVRLYDCDASSDT
jgi:hypothetical protein